MQTKFMNFGTLSKGVAFVMLCSLPALEADAQIFKKIFKKREKVETTTAPVPAVADTVAAEPAEPEPSDTIVNLTAYMPENIKTDSLAPFADYSTIEVNDRVMTVNGVTFKMVCVQGGTFLMGCTMDQMYRSELDEYPSHRVALSTYLIGETEVTQELWQAVMGKNPSNFKNPKSPVESVTWYDCQRFIAKLNQITGMEFRLPTEAEWEYAARGGVFSGNWMYAGSDELSDVAWWVSNTEATKTVNRKKPNELGIYDMSGNVAEWCYDWYGEYSPENQTNPAGPQNGTNRCVRGGHWIDGSNAARVAFRYSLGPQQSNYNTGLRLVCKVTDADIAATNQSRQMRPRHYQQFDTQWLKTETFKVRGVKFSMIGVQGGAFLMGATLEQTLLADADEQPCHNVALSSYRIGQTEVTQALWKVVMGSNPSHHRGDNLPVENVSWDDCQTFIAKLNQMTGQKFRLPTEAEWEYAARGGNLSQGYHFIGNDTCNVVAWNAHICSSTNPAAYLKPNELGIYDMGGNVAEWCEDWYMNYSTLDQTNPMGPGGGYNRVVRGSHWEDGMRYCRSSYRSSQRPNTKTYYIGLRLAL